jgi:diguanylate cyclase (GGDEF)-like protein
MLDYQQYVDTCGTDCAVLSVERKSDGSCGEIRIICANETYKQTMGPAYHDGMRYEELVPKDPKFEDFCFRAAILGQPMHAYVETRALGFWTDQMIIPLRSDSSDIGYCQFVFEFTKPPDASRMANVSADVASAAIETSVSLMRSEDFHSGLSDALHGLLRFSGGFISRVMIVDHDRKRAINYCEVIADRDLLDESLGDGTIDYEVMKTWEDMIGVSNAVIVNDEQSMRELEPKNPEWVASMRENGVESLVLIPLRDSNDVFGYMYIVNFDHEKVVEVKELIELMAFFLGTNISNHLLMEKLERLSNLDVLTGLYNRRAMIERMHAMKRRGGKQPYGVVNIDLNGLKYVNDTAGHEAGDHLIIQAAELLDKVFYKEDLFRTGGDEFIVITQDITEDTFARKVERLRRDIQKNADVSFAIGAFWTDGSVDMTNAFHCADQRMYEDKKAYYERNPEYCRR